jgi:polysaccharide deacetylase 2 family uncharacterized protein YibQ
VSGRRAANDKPRKKWFGGGSGGKSGRPKGADTPAAGEPQQPGGTEVRAPDPASWFSGQEALPMAQTPAAAEVPWAGAVGEHRSASGELSPSEVTAPIAVIGSDSARVGEPAPVDATAAIPAAVAGAAAPPSAAAGFGASPVAHVPPAVPPQPQKETLADVAARTHAASPIATQTTTIADLARAQDDHAVEHAIAEAVETRTTTRKRVLIGVALALVGAMLGTAGALYAISRTKRQSPQVAKVGLQPGLVSTPATTVAEATLTAGAPTATAAQIGIVILGLGDGSNETSANLSKFTQMRLPLTFAVLPKRAGTGDDAAEVQASGGQAVVYQPVGGSGSTADGQKGAITASQSNRQLANTIIGNANEVTGNSGLVPFGFKPGKYPAKAVRLVPVMAMRKNVFILQSSRTTDTPISAKAKALGVHYLVPDWILDAKSGEKYFRTVWGMALKRADKKGRVVVVCRLTGLSARVLPSLLAALDTTKYQLTLVSAMP